MKTKNIFWAMVEAGLWYLFAVYFFYSLQNPTDIWTTALVLLVLGYLAAWACPLIRNSGTWKNAFGKNES
ncbi:MAG: hypothetical protein AAB913_02670 [Patescibacteria group bacterium]